MLERVRDVAERGPHRLEELARGLEVAEQRRDAGLGRPPLEVARQGAAQAAAEVLPHVPHRLQPLLPFRGDLPGRHQSASIELLPERVLVEVDRRPATEG